MNGKRCRNAAERGVENCRAGRAARACRSRGAVFLAGLIAVLALGLALSGCAGLKRPAVEKRHFDLRPERGERVAAPQGAPNLRLRRVQVSPLCSGREMVFRSGPGAFASDYYNTWFVPPADMLSQGLRQWLDGSGLFAHVLDGASLAGASLALEGTANALYGDFSGDAPAAVAEMQFLLLNEATGHNEIVFSGSYEERVPLTSEAPAELAAGLRQGVAAIFARLESDLGKVPDLAAGGQAAR
ncbi:ABC-type transport auxiliary lipoprotein family protein [Paucidesulfovibrio longus]|uniref:ABC-type transport auxiliary lipoprotein family protein n=1 Tax=Paucidesulfovibrio longus TaxID=889 RepID=UPI0009DBF6D0|nr:ABC-type transport auxiliary lipoprotein family protein [Paucidesulfovibrio longus]